MRRSVFHGMLFHLNTAPVCVCVYGFVCQRARVVLFFNHHSCHAWRHDSRVAPHSEHVCTWLSWSLGRVHPWHACYMHICHRCTSQHLVTLPHLMLLPSMCVSATLLKQTSCHHCSCQEKKIKIMSETQQSEQCRRTLRDVCESMQAITTSAEIVHYTVRYSVHSLCSP